MPWIETSAEVWAVIRARHREMKVFSSYSNPDGTCPLGRGGPEMKTEYGFPGAAHSLLRAETQWERGSESWERVNEAHQFWIWASEAEQDT